MTAQELAVELRESGRQKIRFAAATMLESGDFVSPRYDPKRCSDKVEALTEELAMERKRSNALLCTNTLLTREAEQVASDKRANAELICTNTRLTKEIEQVARANAQLVQTVMELRQRGNGMESLTAAVAELRNLK